MNPPLTAVRGRPVTLSREGDVFRLAFNYDPDLVAQAKNLPFATFDGETRSWTARACAQTLQELRRMWHQGLLDVGPDDLLHPGENLPEAREAVLRAGTNKRPYYVHFATRGSTKFPAFRAIPGAQWEKKAGALSYAPAAAAALADMVDRGVLDDPDNLLTTAGVTVSFDGRTGRFAVRGDGRAAGVFNTYFPARDVVAEWKTKGLDVDFLDDYTQMMYRGELARVGEGFQPDGLKLDLMPFQKQCVALALERPGVGVYMEPGLGKSSVGISTGLELFHRDQIVRTIVVVPAAVRTQWAREIVKFTHTDPTDIVVVRGDRKSRMAAYEAGLDAKWVIVHYDVLARDEADLKALFNGAFVIADEAHRVKNYAASRTKALRALCRGARRRMALTGTPVETHPGEWFEVLSGFAVPGCLGTPGEFNERYRWKARFGGFEGARNLGELRERSRPFYIRFTKSQVATHLPPLRVQTVALDPSAAYEAALRRAHNDATEEIRNAALARAGAGRIDDGQFKLLDATLADEVEDGAAMTAVGQLRLLCSSPRLINADSAAGKALIDSGLIPDEDGPKVDEVRTLCAELLASQQRRHADYEDASRAKDTATAEEVTGERIVLFTFSKRMANLLAERLTEDGVPYVLFTGDTNGDARDAAVAAFTDPTSDVIAFIATDAAAEGLNLGTCCSTLVNVDLPWTPSRIAQRSQRIHRLDGTAPHYQVTNLIVAGTMEHGVLKLLEARSDMADALFGERGTRHNTLGARTRTKGGSFAAQALEEYAGSHPPRKARKKDPAPTGTAAPAPAEPPDWYDEDEPPPPPDEYHGDAPAPVTGTTGSAPAPDGIPAQTPDGQLRLL